MAKENLNSVILGLCFIIGCTIGGYYLYSSKKANSRVTVKGLSEKNVTADLAWWSITTQVSGNTVEDVNRNITNGISRINKFLKQNGFNDEEIKTDNISVYQNNYRDATYKFNGDVRVVVSTPDINKIDKGARNIANLIADGILIKGDKYSNGPKYFFTKFSDVKPEMLAEATSEAKKAAEEFAKNSGAKVGKISYANQGVFRILPSNRTSDSEEFYKEKLIRVVSTVDYFLE
jgi:hypothetical protein